MRKLQVLSFFILSLVVTLLLTCTGESPFKPGDATVNLVLENSSGQVNTTSITDTVERPVRIGLRAYLPSYINSVRVTVTAAVDTDTTLTLSAQSNWKDTFWINMPFRSTGTHTVTIVASVAGSDKLVTGQIVIFGVPVTFSAQPAGLTVAQNGSAHFSVTPSGTGVLKYQWRKDGTAITGDTNASMMIDTVRLADSGSYTCMVRNQWGDSLESHAAILKVTPLNSSVNAAPKWSHDTLQLELHEGVADSLNLADSCKDTNGDIITYKLKSAGSVADSLVGSIWKYTPAFTDSGMHVVKIMASDGMDSSTVILLVHVAAINRPPVAITQSVNVGRNIAKMITLAATDSDGDRIALYRISKAANHGTVTFSDTMGGIVKYTPDIDFIGLDTFDFDASDGRLWSLISAKVLVTVDSNKVAPKIQTQPRTDTTVNQGGSVTFTVAINNAFPTPTFTWYKGTKGIALVKFTGQQYLILSAADTDAGYYYVVATNSSGADTSSYAHLAVNSPPHINTPLPSTSPVNQGSTTILQIVALGTAPLEYQWYKNNLAMPGETLSTYTKTWQYADTGIYKIVATNIAGNASSATIVLIKDVTKPSITLVGATDTIIAAGTTWNDPKYLASDDKDGVLTDSVKVTISHSFNSASPGIDTFFYSVNDAAQNSADPKTRIVRVRGWMPVGAQGALIGTDFATAMGANNDLILVYVDAASGLLKSRKIGKADSMWSTLSTVSTGSASSPYLALNNTKDGFYAAFRENTTRISLSYFNGEAWNSKVSSVCTNKIFPPGFPFAFQSNPVNNSAFLIGYDYQQWGTFVPDSASGCWNYFTHPGDLSGIVAGYPCVDVTGNGVPLLAFYNSGSNNIWVARNDTSGLSFLSTGLTNSGTTCYSLVLDQHDLPYVLASDISGDPSLWHLAGTWSSLGTIKTGIVNGIDMRISFADNNLYVGYIDGDAGKTDTAFVKVYSDGWKTFPALVGGRLPVTNVMSTGNRLAIQIGDGVYYATYKKQTGEIATLRYIAY
jgi:hypothetical protein